MLSVSGIGLQLHQNPRQSGDRLRDRPGPPVTDGLGGRFALSRPNPPASVQHGPTRPTTREIPWDTAHRFLASWTPSTTSVRCPRKRSNPRRGDRPSSQSVFDEAHGAGILCTLPVELGTWRIDGPLSRVPAVRIDLESWLEDILDQESHGVNIGAVFFKVSKTMNASTRVGPGCESRSPRARRPAQAREPCAPLYLRRAIETVSSVSRSAT